ncbi:MAG: roadblock/LC7 domain-containing protein [Methanobacteriota archaeon]|nr:MAG: roadblock/LC7 domain-containing protein [Euryarchaeota archaeon]
MAQYMAVEKTLDDLHKNMPSVYEATVVSRSGMHIAGDAPKGVHLETFVAMSAILLGAAETATGELKDKLKYVSVELSRSKMLLSSAGNRALLVITSSDDVSTDELAASMSKYADIIAGQI